MRTDRLLCTLKGHNNWVTAVAFSPDSKRLVSGSLDKTAKVWELETGRELLTLNGHHDEVTGVEFSSDGQRIVTSGRDGEVRVWSVAPLKTPSENLNSAILR